MPINWQGWDREVPFRGPESACGISAGCQEPEKQKYRDSLKGLKHAKEFQRGTRFQKNYGSIKMNRNASRQLSGLVRGRCHLEGHIFKFGLIYNCHVIFAWEKINHLHMSCVTVRLQPTSPVTLFVRSVRLFKG